MPAAQVGPQTAEVDLAAAEDSDRFAGGVGEQAPEQVFAGDLSPVAAALAWRQEPPPHGEAAALLSRELVPLYVHYLDDHIARLRAVGQQRLADRFRRWRTRLLA